MPSTFRADLTALSSWPPKVVTAYFETRQLDPRRLPRQRHRLVVGVTHFDRRHAQGGDQDHPRASGVDDLVDRVGRNDERRVGAEAALDTVDGERSVALEDNDRFLAGVAM